MQSDAEHEALYVAADNEIENGGDDKHAFRILLDLANRGYLPAMCYVGVLYCGGIGTPENKKLAIGWWRKAAAKGDGTSMLNLGTEYRDVLGNFRQARHWLLKAARSGDASAYLELARLWYGRDRFRHRDRIARYLDEALDKHRLGQCYLSEDERESAELLRAEFK